MEDFVAELTFSIEVEEGVLMIPVDRKDWIEAPRVFVSWDVVLERGESDATAFVLLADRDAGELEAERVVVILTREVLVVSSFRVVLGFLIDAVSAFVAGVCETVDSLLETAMVDINGD